MCVTNLALNLSLERDTRKFKASEEFSFDILHRCRSFSYFVHKYTKNWFFRIIFRIFAFSLSLFFCIKWLSENPVLDVIVLEMAWERERENRQESIVADFRFFIDGKNLLVFDSMSSLTWEACHFKFTKIDCDCCWEILSINLIKISDFINNLIEEIHE